MCKNRVFRAKKEDDDKDESGTLGISQFSHTPHKSPIPLSLPPTIFPNQTHNQINSFVFFIFPLMSLDPFILLPLLCTQHNNNQKHFVFRLF